MIKDFICFKYWYAVALTALLPNNEVGKLIWSSWLIFICLQIKILLFNLLYLLQLTPSFKSMCLYMFCYISMSKESLGTVPAWIFTECFYYKSQLLLKHDRVILLHTKQFRVKLAEMLMKSFCICLSVKHLMQPPFVFQSQANCLSCWIQLKS